MIGAGERGMMCFSPAAVNRWKQAWEKGGKKALAGKPHPSGKARLTHAQLQQLFGLFPQGRCGSHSRTA